MQNTPWLTKNEQILGDWTVTSHLAIVHSTNRLKRANKITEHWKTDLIYLKGIKIICRQNILIILKMRINKENQEQRNFDLEYRVGRLFILEVLKAFLILDVGDIPPRELESNAGMVSLFLDVLYPITFYFTVHYQETLTSVRMKLSFHGSLLTLKR